MAAMPTTFHLRVWTRFLAPIDEVWKLETDPAEISAGFRPLATFRFSDEAALARALAGEVPVTVDARFGFGPVGVVAWPSTLDVVEPGKRFRDTSENALFSRWEHEHLFEETPDGCRYVDAVTFTPKLPAQKIMAIATQRMFQRRHRAAAKRLPTDPQATAVGVLRVLVEGESAPG